MKQDRQGVRTPADIERKYDLNQDVSKIAKMAADAQISAKSAENAAENANNAAENAVSLVSNLEQNLGQSVAQNTSDIAELSGRVEDLEQGGGGSGENGATFTPSVDDDGNLSWTNDKGLSNPETVNIKGEKGDPGEDGKSAYQSAVDGGYIGTEDDFNKKLAAGSFPATPGENEGVYWTDATKLNMQGDSIGFVGVTGSSVSLQTRPNANSALRGLYLYNKNGASSVKNILKLRDEDGNYYLVYGEHNTHGHTAADIVSGTLSTSRLPTVPISKGGTGATTAETARTNLGAASNADLNNLDSRVSALEEQGFSVSHDGEGNVTIGG